MTFVLQCLVMSSGFSWPRPSHLFLTCTVLLLFKTPICKKSCTYCLDVYAVYSTLNSVLSTIVKISWLKCSDFWDNAARTVVRARAGDSSTWRLVPSKSCCIVFSMFFWRSQDRGTVYTTSRSVGFWHCQHKVPFFPVRWWAKMRRRATWWPLYSLMASLFHILNSEPRFVSTHRQLWLPFWSGCSNKAYQL
jgi:hypothetical protein